MQAMPPEQQTAYRLWCERRILEAGRRHAEELEEQEARRSNWEYAFLREQRDARQAAVASPAYSQGAPVLPSAASRAEGGSLFVVAGAERPPGPVPPTPEGEQPIRGVRSRGRGRGTFLAVPPGGVPAALPGERKPGSYPRPGV